MPTALHRLVESIRGIGTAVCLGTVSFGQSRVAESNGMDRPVRLLGLMIPMTRLRGCF
ncbi:hypothetical protein RB213_006734, partial [Colletotrichum asianum]